jgi:hypothetical protein
MAKFLYINFEINKHRYFQKVEQYEAFIITFEEIKIEERLDERSMG